MGSSYNRCILVGNLCRDPELRYAGESAVCDISLAVNDRVKSKSGTWEEQATFVDVTCWGKTAETLSSFCSKGSSILIEGRLKLDSWNDKNTGDKRSKLKVVAEKMQMVGGKAKQEESFEATDDIPF
jgi:single-strand DNA-binding protein